MSNFKTAKGTVLPILLLKGKEYLEVKYRLVWFREEHADYGIETEFLTLTADVAVAKATIRDAAGRILSQGTKSETPKGFPDFIEKAESGAIGRALALIGYGTQFCGEELDEGERIVDSPIPPRSRPAAVDSVPSFPSPKASPESDLGSYVITFGNKYRGKRLDACDVYELDGFSKWISGLADPSPAAIETRARIDSFLASRSFDRKAGA